MYAGGKARKQCTLCHSVGLSEAVAVYTVIRRVEIKPREHSLAGSFQRGPPDRLQRVCLADEVNRASIDEVEM